MRNVNLGSNDFLWEFLTTSLCFCPIGHEAFLSLDRWSPESHVDVLLDPPVVFHWLLVHNFWLPPSSESIWCSQNTEQVHVWCSFSVFMVLNIQQNQREEGSRRTFTCEKSIFGQRPALRSSDSSQSAAALDRAKERTLTFLVSGHLWATKLPVLRVCQ